MVKDAMRFDADGDGKLSRDELRKFAQDLARRGPPGGRGFRRGPGNGEGPPDGPPGDDSDRPARPERSQD
jgi:hypothetical protein